MLQHSPNMVTRTKIFTQNGFTKQIYSAFWIFLFFVRSHKVPNAGSALQAVWEVTTPCTGVTTFSAVLALNGILLFFQLTYSYF